MRNAKQDLLGRIFFRLTVIAPVEEKMFGRVVWLCRCECGTEKTIFARHLISGRSKSCGCYRRDFSPLHLATHGNSTAVAGNPTREYVAWAAMKRRCYSEAEHNFDRYGGRGIKVCASWLNDFAAFLADMGRCPKGLSIDRIDNDGDYEPSNCRWADNFTQARNRSNNHKITFRGVTKCIVDWADDVGLKRETLSRRINRYGWTIERALTEPAGPPFGIVRTEVK